MALKAGKLTQLILKEEKLTVDAAHALIIKTLLLTKNRTTINTLQHFDAEVPHRFLSPWFKSDNRNIAMVASQSFINDCPYALFKDHIVINPKWVDYLQLNAGILKGFCYWHLAQYLQLKNPNVPDIPGKLVKPAERNNLNGPRKLFWDIVLKEKGSVNCIYTGEPLTVGHYDVEHFIPFAFVSHDLIWNLIPADPQFNCVKSDKLPLLDMYFEGFYKLQTDAIEVIQDITPGNKYLQEYVTIWPELDLTKHRLSPYDKNKYREQLQPLVTIASNNGFEFLKVQGNQA